jgi:hypothetical protein
MSMFRILASIVGLALIGAFITNPLDVGSKAATEPAPVAAKENRSEILASGSGWACAQEPWPYGANGGPRRNGSSSVRQGRSEASQLVPTPAKST